MLIPDPSVESDGLFNRIDWNVENGTAYDRAVVDLGEAKKIVLPDDANIQRCEEGSKIQLYIVKKLSFGGHPPESMSIHEQRKKMGCAIKTDDKVLLVATYGEWDSRIEGGAFIELVAFVPVRVEVEQRKGLSGPDSAGRGKQTSLAEGWAAVPSVPNPSRTADKAYLE